MGYFYELSENIFNTIFNYKLQIILGDLYTSIRKKVIF